MNCGYCTGATIGEAEHLYKGLTAGTVLDAPSEYIGLQGARGNLRQRQKEEVETGYFDDVPDLKERVWAFCQDSSLTEYDLEHHLEDLRHEYGRPVWTTEQVDAKVLAARLKYEAETGEWKDGWDRDVASGDGMVMYIDSGTPDLLTRPVLLTDEEVVPAAHERRGLIRRVRDLVMG